MALKTKTQTYFYLRTPVQANLNRLETELDFYLQRENRRAFANSQELSRWVEMLAILVQTLNTIHKRSKLAALNKAVDNTACLKYKLTERLSITIYKSLI